MLSSRKKSHRTTWLNIVTSSWASLGFPSAFARDKSKDEVPVETQMYTVQPKDTLSEILYKKGLGRPHSPYRLYGRDGWVERNIRRNPGINWLSIGDPGTSIYLEIPVALVPPVDKAEEVTKEAPNNTTTTDSSEPVTPEPEP